MAVITCNCGKSFTIPDGETRRVRCKACGTTHGGATRPNQASTREPSDSMSFPCPKCGWTFSGVPAAFSGRRARCKKCAAEIRVPTRPARVEPTLASAPPDDIYGLAEEKPVASPLPRQRTVPLDPTPRERSSDRDSIDRDERVSNALRSGLGLIGFGFVTWLLPSYGILLRSRADRRAGRPGDPVSQRFVGQCMMVMGILILAWGGIKVFLAYRNNDDGPLGETVGRAVWTSAALLGLAGIVFLVVNNFVTSLVPAGP